ncbi:RNA polymerase sigma factor [Amycolatopsis sp. GM8]|uniref:RNA polymerase sigma factor n=1 Tax=Amycolatopsis sp. GM8 TaxID=2896530 RepID=UPI001F36223C|nr:sigma-70 family RNA polymerase sigma factor [Amycolatopsis sp. GM8]
MVAFADFYRQYYPQVRGLAAGLARDPEAAEDLVSEVFVRILEKVRAREWSAGKDVRTQIQRMTHNTYYQNHRRDGRVQLVPDLPDGESVLEGIGAVLEREDRLDCVERAFLTLSQRYRTALWLKYVAGWSNEEVGNQLSVATGTAAVVAFRARERFQQEYRRLLAVTPDLVASGRN